MKKTFKDKLWDKTGLSFWEDYSQFINPIRWNWITFNVIHCNIEWDKYDNSFNLELALFGLNMRWQLKLPGETKQSKELEKIVKKYEKSKNKL